MGKVSSNKPFQCKVEPLDDIQFDCDEEIKVPISVELRHKDAKVPKKSHPRSCCYDLKSLEDYCLQLKKCHTFDLGLAFKMKKGWKLPTDLDFPWSIKLKS